MPIQIKTGADYQNAAKHIQALFESIAAEVDVTTEAEIAKIAGECMSEAAARAPHDLGNLQESAYVAVNGTVVAHPSDTHGMKLPVSPAKPGTVSAEIGFTAPYAFVQHEHIEFNHPSLKRQKEGEAPPIGEAKFLERTVEENKEDWIRRLKDAAIKALRGES